MEQKINYKEPGDWLAYLLALVIILTLWYIFDKP